MKLFITLLTFVVVFVSCSENKNETPNPTLPVADSVTLLNKVYHYGSPDTTLPYSGTDTIYYNAARQIEQITSLSASREDTMWYKYTYDGNGNISSMATTSTHPASRDVTYKFHYDANNRLDSLWRGYSSFDIAYLFSYDAQGHMQKIRAYYVASRLFLNPPQAGDPLAEVAFFRGSPTVIDSIYFGLVNFDQNSTTYNLQLMANMQATPVMKADVISKAYLFRLATYQEAVLQVDDVNIYLYQFLNPDVSLYKSSQYNLVNTLRPEESFTGRANTFTAALNADNLPHWIMLQEGAFLYNSNKFEYIKVKI